MNKEHIYLHTSNLDYTKVLIDCKYFKMALEDYMPYHYFNPGGGYRSLSREEYGIIEIDDLCIHILVGKMRKYFCPWCGSDVKGKEVIEERTSDSLFTYNAYCMQCDQCGARGPVTKVKDFSVSSDLKKEILFDILRDKFAKLLPWEYKILDNLEPKKQ